MEEHKKLIEEWNNLYKKSYDESTQLNNLHKDLLSIQKNIAENVDFMYIKNNIYTLAENMEKHRWRLLCQKILNDEELTQEMLQGIDLSKEYYHNTNLAYFLTCSGKSKYLPFLLENGLNPFKYCRGVNALGHNICGDGDSENVEMARILLEKYPDLIDAKTKDQEDCLSLCNSHIPGVIELLLKHGAGKYRK